jgi:hypothetical protein
LQHLSPYQHINIKIPHTTYKHITYQHTTSHTHISHIHTHIPHTHIPTYHIPHTTLYIPTYHISHSTYHIPHTTYQHTPHSILSLLFRGFFYCPNLCVCQYSIILSKYYTIIIIQKYFCEIEVFKLMAFWWIMHLVMYQLVSSGPLPFVFSLFFCFFLKDYLANIVDYASLFFFPFTSQHLHYSFSWFCFTH